MTALSSQLTLRPQADENELRRLELEYGCKLPADYLAFLRTSNGALGYIGRSHIGLWSVDEVIESNRGYAVAQFVPRVILFATDFGGFGYGFDTRRVPMSVLEFDLAGGLNFNDARHFADGFLEFLQALGTR